MQKACKRAVHKVEWKHLRNTIEDGLSKNNPKPFWWYIKAKKQDNSDVSPLKSKGSPLCDAKSKAEILVDQFCSLFTQETLTNLLPKLPQYNPITALYINEDGVASLLRKDQQLQHSRTWPYTQPHTKRMRNWSSTRLNSHIPDIIKLRMSTTRLDKCQHYTSV